MPTRPVPITFRALNPGFSQRVGEWGSKGRALTAASSAPGGSDRRTAFAAASLPIWFCSAAGTCWRRKLRRSNIDLAGGVVETERIVQTPKPTLYRAFPAGKNLAADELGWFAIEVVEGESPAAVLRPIEGWRDGETFRCRGRT
jgi:hypothetical protein